MKILWITNIIFPEPSKVLGIPEPVIGGWMYGLASKITSTENIQLAVATIYTGNELITFEIDGILYYLLPCRNSMSYSENLEPLWQKICADFKPDIIHIHGTEFTHGLACMRACQSQNYIVSIQGLVSVYARYYYAGLCFTDILKSITFRDILRFDTLFHAKNKFFLRGIFEKEYIQRTKHVIGRTSWDYVHTKTINPSVNYHFCNETLRAGFYTSKKWSIVHKTDHTIFLSQAGYPIKGFHQVLKAVALLKNDFPQIIVRVSGEDITKTNTLKDKIKHKGYFSYIKTLIKKLDLQEQVQFIGTLTEEQMIAEYINAHLFICPSSIENSPNSLGEAQLLGVPVIASYVGGIPDMVKYGETGLLYPFGEVEMMAEKIREIFLNDDFANYLSFNAIELAYQRHNVSTNLNRTIDIYRLIIK